MRRMTYRLIIFAVILILISVIASYTKKPEETVESDKIMSTTTVKSEGFTEPEGCT